LVLANLIYHYKYNKYMENDEIDYVDEYMDKDPSPYDGDY